MRLGSGRELGSLYDVVRSFLDFLLAGFRHTHDNNSALLVQDNTIPVHMLCALLHYLSETRIEGIGKADVSNDTALEEGKRTNALCAVNDLVGDDKVHWLNLLLQRSNGGESDDGSNADVTQSSNVGAVGDLVGRKLVVDAMPRQEGNIHAVVREDMDRGGGRAPRGDGVEGGDGLEAFKLAEAGTANDGDVDGLCEIFSILMLGGAEHVGVRSKVVGRSPIFAATVGWKLEAGSWPKRSLRWQRLRWTWFEEGSDGFYCRCFSLSSNVSMPVTKNADGSSTFYPAIPVKSRVACS